MAAKKQMHILIKMIVFQVVFLVLHYLYEWFPGAFTRLVSATSEAVYEHLKVAVLAYLLVNMLEWFVGRKWIGDQGNFIFARLFSTLILPWMIFLFFFISPAYFVKINSIPGEIVFANIALLLSSFCTIVIERQVEKAKIDRAFRWITVILLLVLFSQMVIFSYRLPWFDVFAIPPGWE